MSNPQQAEPILSLDESGKKPVLSFETLIKLEREAEQKATLEEHELWKRAIVMDHDRIFRQTREIAGRLAAERFSPEQLVEWKHLHAYQAVAGPEMDAERRLAPEAAFFEERMNAVLQKHANVPYGSAGQLLMSQFCQVLNVAAESVEQAAYPGTDDARRRYALALRRCARELREDISNPQNGARYSKWRAIMTLRLSLDDGTTTLWRSTQDLVDFVGRQGDGSSQPLNVVSGAAWQVIWDYVVVSRLRAICPSRFTDLPDLRPYRVNRDGRFVNERGEPIRWIWDGKGSGLLETDAVQNDEAKRIFESAFVGSGMGELMSGPHAAEYSKSPQYREFRRRTAVIEMGVGAAACNALADLQERDIGSNRRTAELAVKQLPWDRLSADDFERFIFSLISSSEGYEGQQWLTQTNAPDRGRDLSVWRVSRDTLAGTRRERVVIACKHWLRNGVGIREIGILRDQMQLWSPPPVDILVIATSGRFTSDGVCLIETHNQSGNRLRIEPWPSSHLERLVAQFPAISDEFFPL